MEASHEGVKFKFIKNEQNSLQGKRLDPVWSHFLRSEGKSDYNRYIALCLYCKRTYAGRLPTMRKHITDQCDLVSSEDRATFIRSMNNTAAPAHLADDMKASSKKRFEMKNEVEVNKVAMKRKKTGSTISAYMEQKLDKNSQEEIHVLLLQLLLLLLMYIRFGKTWNFSTRICLNLQSYYYQFDLMLQGLKDSSLLYL